MAQYKTDLRDAYFNLFEQLKIQDQWKDFAEADLKEIIGQFDKFVEKEIYPSRQTADKEGVHLTKDGVKSPPSLRSGHEQYYQNGWFGLGYPEELGGMPAPHAVSLLCDSMIIGANVSFSMYYGLSRAAMNVIIKVGSQAQKDLYLARMMSGEWGGTMCLTESGAGSDVGAAKTTATPVAGEKDIYAIKGVKIFISSGENDLYDNIIHLVLARTPGAPEGTKGLSLFIVPRYKINADGSKGASNNVRCTKIEEKMGLHGSATCELTFGADGECRGQLIGQLGQGMPLMFIMMNEARLLCGLQGDAQASLAYQLTEQYVKERVQFGKEIVHHPDVKRTMVKMRAMVRGMRALNLYTANLFDEMQSEEDAASLEVALLTPICKAYCSDEGFDVSVQAVQMHGGYGYCSEYGIEQFVRDIKIATIYEGTNGIQAIDFVMRKILKDQGKVFGALGQKIAKSLAKPGIEQLGTAELKLVKDSLQSARSILEHFGAMAKSGAAGMDRILVHATDFLSYCGNLIVAWRLLESALTATQSLSSAKGDDKHFYQSKLIDFNVFCQHYLTRNTAIKDRILGFDDNFAKWEI